VISAIDGVQDDQDPFPHVIIRDFFPKSLFETLLEFLPADDRLAPFAEGKYGYSDAGASRLRMDLGDAATARLGTAGENLWRGVRDILGCQAVQKAIYSKLAPGLAFRYSQSEKVVSDKKGYALPALFRERSGYRIKPHPDTRKKVVTMQICLAPNDQSAHLGTEFYRRNLNPTAFFREPRGFDIVKTAPFTRNTAYAFVVLNAVTWKSWHGRTTLHQKQEIRNSILNIWHEQPENGSPEVVRDHYEDAARILPMAA
jgi:hypothetical protein